MFMRIMVRNVVMESLESHCATLHNLLKLVSNVANKLRDLRCHAERQGVWVNSYAPIAGPGEKAVFSLYGASMGSCWPVSTLEVQCT